MHVSVLLAGFVCTVIHITAVGGVSSTTKAGESTGEIPPQENIPRPGHNDGDSRKKRQTCTDSEFRTADGTCNNLENPTWGSSNQPFERILAAVYDDGVKLPRAKTTSNSALPLPRTISNTVHFHLNFTAKGATSMLMEWGQFIAHDVVSTQVVDHSEDCCNENNYDAYLTGLPCFPIMIPVGDAFLNTCMNFTRSKPATTDGVDDSPRNQYNTITAFIDASNVYGSSIDETNALRSNSGGLLLVENNNGLDPSNDLLPNLGVTDCRLDSADSDDYCFSAGDERVNVFPPLNALHTLFMREHNRLATFFAASTDWDDEKLFQTARKIVGAEMQVITYRHWLPRIIGNTAMATYGLDPGSHVYNSASNPTLSNVFATAAFRFGHTMLPEKMTIGETDYDLVDLFYKPKFVRNSLGDVINGIISTNMQRIDAWYVDGMRNHLFETETSPGLDIVSLNIQRGRDHGLPALNAWRNECSLEDITDFTAGQFSDRPGKDLAKVYSHPDDVDLYSGGVSEVSVTGGSVGGTYACLLGRQFKLLKEGDRFFYETTDATTGFSTKQLRQIQKTSLERIICDNVAEITSLQKRVFQPISDSNVVSSCDNKEDIKEMDLSRWTS